MFEKQGIGPNKKGTSEDQRGSWIDEHRGFGLRRGVVGVTGKEFGPSRNQVLGLTRRPF